MHKGLAPPSLLESYTQERLPVIAAMLNITTTLLNKAFQAGTEGSASSWTRGEEFKQLGVNYRGSPIVVDHTPNAGKNEFVDPYRSGGGQGDLRGGDRAPDGPGLAAVLGPSVTHIFDLFGSTYHTVLIFSAGVETQKAVLDAVKRHAEGTIRTAIVLPRGHATPPAEDIVADHLIEDFVGLAYETYGSVVGKGLEVIVVRPDGVVGAIVEGGHGLEEYFASIFV